MKIAITGVSGRMGRMLVETVDASERAVVSAAVEQSGHPWIGRDLGEVLGGAARGIAVSEAIEDALRDAEAVIDFTAPAASVAFASAAAAVGAIHIVGTTGMSTEDIRAVDSAGQRAVIVRAGNMSLGVNLLVQLTKRVAAALDDDFDIEVVEYHHNKKVDAPSGTALMLGEAAAEGRGRPLADVADRGRDGITGARKKGDIGFVAVRGGDIVGEHDVMFAAPGERIILRHIASDRAVFARGAVKAALWARGKRPGAYDMLDVLGLKKG